jgi:hypothetical protein
MSKSADMSTRFAMLVLVVLLGVAVAVYGDEKDQPHRMQASDSLQSQGMFPGTRCELQDGIYERMGLPTESHDEGTVLFNLCPPEEIFTKIDVATSFPEKAESSQVLLPFRVLLKP